MRNTTTGAVEDRAENSRELARRDYAAGRTRTAYPYWVDRAAYAEAWEAADWEGRD